MPASGPSSSACAPPARSCSGPNCLGVFDAQRRARPRLERVPAGTDRAHLPEREPRRSSSACSPPTSGSGSRASRRSGTRPTSRSAELVAGLRGPRADAGDRAVRARTSATGARLRPRCSRRGRGGQAGGRSARRSRGEASARAARSHTGALVERRAAVEAACRARASIRVATPAELVDLAQAFLVRHRPRGRRVAVVGDGGGHVVIAADLADRPRPRAPDARRRACESARRRLAPDGRRPETRSTSQAAASRTSRTSSASPASCSSSGEVDAVLLTGYFGGYSEYSDEFRKREIEVARGDGARPRHGGPAARRPHDVLGLAAGRGASRREAFPSTATIEAAVGALLRLVRADRSGRSCGVPDLPEPAEQPLGCGTRLLRGPRAARRLPASPSSRPVGRSSRDGGPRAPPTSSATRSC